MQFLRSIKSAKALGLAAATVATMTATTVAPSMAQVAPTRTITFIQGGGYVADYFITFPGQKGTFEALGIPVSQRRSFQIPLGANVTVTQRMSHNRQVYFQRSFRLNSNTCFRNFGTIFNPAAANC
jgi:hypothetical protein